MAVQMSTGLPMSSRRTVEVCYSSNPEWLSHDYNAKVYLDAFDKLREEYNIYCRGNAQYQITGKLGHVVPQVPPPSQNPSCFSRLSIRKNEIISTIKNNQVSLFIGYPIGKSIAIPEFILENSASTFLPVRIISVCPEKLSAPVLAHRVASNRGESVGEIIGYQMPLESRISPTTIVTFCSASVLLRTLMGDNTLDSITHIVLNDIHKKSRLFDLIMAALKVYTRNQASMKIILLSNFDDANWTSRHFWPLKFGILRFDVEAFGANCLYLEHLQSKGVLACKEKKEIQNVSNLEPWALVAVDTYIKEAFSDLKKSALSELLELILYHKVPVDMTHSEHAITTLAAAYRQTNIPAIKMLLDMGASVDKLYFVKPQIREVLQNLRGSGGDGGVKFNCDLVLKSIELAVREAENNILVLLPSFIEVELVKFKLQNQRFAQDFQVYSIHTHAQFKNLKDFYSVELSHQAIILATDLSESLLPNLAIDVLIDSGLQAQRGTGSEPSCLRWISKQEAHERSNYASLFVPGCCYRLYTQWDFKKFPDAVEPEITSTGVTDMMLYSRLFHFPQSDACIDILTTLPHTPGPIEILKANSMLHTINLLDLHNDLTVFGYLVTELDLPINAARMLLFGVILKCIDPVLTIASCLDFKSEFAKLFRCPIAMASARQTFGISSNVVSDHLIVLKALQQWQLSSRQGHSAEFCASIGIEESVFEAVLVKRGTVLAQLRALGLVRSRGNSDIRDLNENSDSWPVVKAAICGGTSPNFGEFDGNPLRVTVNSGNCMSIAPSSCFYEFALLRYNSEKPVYFVYDSSDGATSPVINWVTAVSPATLVLFTTPYILPIEQSVFESRRGSTSSGLNVATLLNGLSLRMPQESLTMVLSLRNVFYSFVSNRIKKVHTKECESESSVLRKVIDILKQEEVGLGLSQPEGIGQRPLPASGDSNPVKV